MKNLLIVLLLLLISPISYSATNQPLPANQAYQLSTRVVDANTIEAHLAIAPGYYLYREYINASIQPDSVTRLGKIDLPEGIKEHNEILGDYQAYENEVTIKIPFIQAPTTPFSLILSYQGCAKSGFCYPKIRKTLSVHLTGNVATSSVTIAASSVPNVPIITSQTPHVSEQDRITQILAGSNLLWIIISFFGFGLLLAFTPCVLPLIPILSSIIVGQQQLTTAKAFKLSLVYVLSMAITYAAAGMLAALAGSHLQSALQKPGVLITFSLLFVLLALSLFGLYELRLPNVLQDRLVNLSNRQKGGHYVGVIIMGCLSTLIVSPCVSAPLVGALAYIGQTGDVFLGGIALLFMGLGMGLPLLIIGTSGGKLLPKAGPWMDNVKTFFGIMLLGVAIWLVHHILPGPVKLLLWGALLIITAINLNVFDTVTTGIEKLAKGLGIIALIYGIVLIIGATVGNGNPLQPIALQKQDIAHSTTESLTFIPIKTVDDLQREITAANAQGRSVMLDFYADWCVSCKQLERETFNDSKVQTALKNFTLLRADVTANDSSDQALEAKLGVIAPPTLIFFDTHGQELKNYRIVGELGPEAFLNQLSQLASSS